MLEHSIVILAGGEGARMNRQDKALVSLAGKTLIQHVIDRNCPPGTPVFISTHPSRPDPMVVLPSSSLQVITDPFDSHEGPLAGVIAALDTVRSPVLVILPCDTPLLPSDIVNRLVETLGDSGKDIIFACDESRIHYLCAAIRNSPNVRDQLQGYFESGRRSMKGLITQLETDMARFDTGPDRQFTNINSPEELHSLEKWLSGASSQN